MQELILEIISNFESQDAEIFKSKTSKEIVNLFIKELKKQNLNEFKKLENSKFNEKDVANIFIKFLFSIKKKRYFERLELNSYIEEEIQKFKLVE